MHKYMLIPLVILLIIVSQPVQSYAHSSLKGTSPAEGEVVKHPLENISFEFSSKIKQGSFTITDQDGESVEVESINYEDNVMFGQLTEELETGIYTVSYEIISEDSHVVEGDFQFSVQTGDSGAPATDEDQTTDDKTEGTPSDQAPANNESASSKPKQGEAAEGLSPFVISLSAILVCTGIGLIWWLLRKKATI